MKYLGTPPGTVIASYKGKVEPIPVRLDLYNHSPTGFSWGYNGSGPSQLALAILAHYLRHASQERLTALKDALGYPDYSLKGSPPSIDTIPWSDWIARRLYRVFQTSIISQLPQGKGFTLTEERVEDGIERALREETLFGYHGQRT